MKRRAFVTLPAVALASSRFPGAAAAAAGMSAAPEGPAIVAGNLPVFAERLKDELTFPLAWQNNRHDDFRAWRRRARG